MYIATLKGVEISGPDAVVTIARKKGKCLVSPGSVGRYAKRPVNLLPTMPNGSKIQTTDAVANI